MASRNGSKGNAVAYGEFIATARERNYPEEVLEAARLCLSDWMAVAIGAGAEPAGEVVRARVEAMHSAGQASVLFGGTAAPSLAALANGTLAHCLDFDDTHVGATTHTSAPVWAATLALAEQHAIDESVMLAAFITGFEVAARVGKPLGQGITARGLHATGVFGRIGAAAASAVVLGLDAEQAGHALGAAATQASGLTASFGTMAKPYHAGKAAMDGVLSAELAADGFVAAPGLLEPDGGLDRALVQDGSLSLAPADFSRWEILRNSFKPYAACHLTHPAIDAARALRVDPERIESVHARVCELAQQITGRTDGQPSTPLAAKFDLRYCTALGLLGRSASAADFEEPWALEPALGTLAAKVEVVGDPQVGYASAKVAVSLRGGTKETFDVAVSKGHPGNPITWEDMRSKYDALVTRPLGAKAPTLFETLRGFGAPGGLTEVRDAVGALG